MPTQPSFKGTLWGVLLVSALLSLAVSFWANTQSSAGTVPRHIYLSAVPFADRPGTETLEKTAGLTPATKVFTNTRATWISLQTYDQGTTFEPGRVQFSLSYRAATCDRPQDCKVSVSWGWCAAACSELSMPAMSFDQSRFSGDNADLLSGSNPAQVVLSGCPCRVYVTIDSRVAPRHSWTLVYGSTSYLQMSLQTGGSLGQLSLAVGLFFIGFLLMFPIFPLVLLVGWIVFTARKTAWTGLRRQAWLAFAQEHGLSLSENPMGVSGNWKGLQITCFDSVKPDGTISSMARAGIAASLPRIDIVPGGSDGNVRLESDDFNRRFAVKTHAQEFAYQLIDARMIGGLLANPWVGYEVEGSEVIAYGPCLPVPGPLLDALLLFVQSIPQLVWRQYGTGAA